MGKLSDYEKKENIGEKEIVDKYNQYKDMNESQLRNELFSEVGRQKNAGTFDYEKLEMMVDGLRGSLPEENYRNIKNILEGLK